MNVPNSLELTGGAGFILEFALAVVLASAALGKVLAWSEWTRSLSRYRVGWLNQSAVAISLPLAEGAIAVGLLVSLEPIAALSAAALFAGFVGVLILARRRGASGDCGCFGALFPAEIGLGAIARAAGLCAAALVLSALPSVGAGTLARAVVVAVIVASGQVVGAARSLTRAGRSGTQ